MKKLMTWLLFALGLLLMVLGTAFLYSGFGLIEIERGAAQVSAGASLLAGGAVTLGVSVILLQLQETLGHLTAHTTAPSGEVRPEVSANMPLMAAGGMAGAGAAVAASVAGLSKMADHHPDADLHPEPEVKSDTPRPHSETLPAPAPEEPTAPAPAVPTPEPSLAEATHDARPTTPSVVIANDTARSALTLVETTPAPDQAADDWFERMFAETSSKPALAAVAAPDDVVHAAEPTAPHPAVTAPETSVAPQHPEPAAHDAAPKVEPLMEPDTKAPHPGSEIVARHEADGITYIMYADGSIEANDGVTSRRFASMDELAASIQN